MRHFNHHLKHFVAPALALIGLMSGAPLPPLAPGMRASSACNKAPDVSSRASSPVPLFTPGEPDQAMRARVSETYGRLPLSFEANQGQAGAQVKFFSRGNGYGLWLTATEAVLASQSEVRMRLVGANTSSQIEGLDQLPGRSNYFLGNDPQRWRTHVASYARVRYREVYPGVDLIYYGDQRQLEYDFVVAPYADPRAITLAFQGARRMRLDANGDLVLGSAGAELRQRKPLVYQEVGGVRRVVAGRYLIQSDHKVGFQVAAYDVSRPLVIDPVLVYSTYLGGGRDDIGVSIAVDAAGSAYVTGKTLSANFPIVTPAQPALAGPSDVFVAKLNPAGSALVYTTYLGGSSSEVGMGIAVDATGSAYVTGLTYSSDFPTRNPAQPARGGGSEAFLSKLNADGSAFVYSTYLGGDADEYGLGVAVDSGGAAYVTGLTSSTNFPTKNPLQPAFGGGNMMGFGSDAFVTKVNATGSTLVYSTYLGGSGDEIGFGIAVDVAGNAYVTGLTSSPNFPTVNALQPTRGGGRIIGADAFVTKLNPGGSALAYSTYLGGGGDDVGIGIAVDTAGNAYVTGATASSDFPTKDPLQPTFGGGASFGSDAFVTKLNAAGGGPVYSTYLGGGADELGFGIAVDTAGNAYVSGTTSSPNFPRKNPTQLTFGGGGRSYGSDAFVVKVDALGQALSYATIIGGSDDDIGLGLAVDGAGNAYLTGATASRNFPTRAPLQPAFGGASGATGDALVVKLGAESGALAVTNVSAASYRGPALAVEAIVAAFGSGLAYTTLAANATPLPTSLAGTSVKVKDGAGTERLAPLFFISPGQINYQIPPGSVAGAATVTIANGNASVAIGPAQIVAVAPGLFAANADGQGVAAAVALRVKADGSQIYEQVARLDTTLNPPRFVSVPLDLGPESDQVFLILFGTGIRFRSALTSALVSVGGTSEQVDYAGPAPGFVGLDQVNARLPRSLIGRGEIDVALTVDDQQANTVRVNIK